MRRIHATNLDAILGLKAELKARSDGKHPESLEEREKLKTSKRSENLIESGLDLSALLGQPGVRPAPRAFSSTRFCVRPRGSCLKRLVLSLYLYQYKQVAITF